MPQSYKIEMPRRTNHKLALCFSQSNDFLSLLLHFLSLYIILSLSHFWFGTALLEVINVQINS